MLIPNKPTESGSHIQLSYSKFSPYTINRQELAKKVIDETEPADVNARHQLIKTTSPTASPTRAPYKYGASFCLGFRDIQGRLTLSDDCISFEETNLSRNNKKGSWLKIFRSDSKVRMQNDAGKCKAVINMKDIADCKIMSFTMPGPQNLNKIEKANILQLVLYNHGDLSFGTELDEVISEMQKKRTPYASVFFNVRISTKEKSPKSNEAIMTLLQIQKRIKRLIDIKSIQEDDECELQTRLPYFEFITENFEAKHKKCLQEGKQLLKQIAKGDLTLLQKQNDLDSKPLVSKIDSLETKSSESSSPPSLSLKPTFMPTMLDKSTIVTDEQFAYIVASVPSLYQSFDWKLLYANSLHGTSYNSLMRRSQHSSHFLLIIRDTHDNVFGAYGSDQLKFSDLYYGTGETFLFSFWKSDEISVFEWSKKNRLFMFVNEDGMMFGTGPFYGLWIGSDLARGRTHACETFNSTPLSDSTDFTISRIEIWSIVDPFTNI